MELHLGCGHLGHDEFVAAFEQSTISPAPFHHADHLRLAWIYAGRDDGEGAEEKLLARSGDSRRKQVCRKSFNAQ